jgi:hypothetical protein
MSNYYSTSLGLILQNPGENSTTWGSFVNTNFQTLLEQAIVGQISITMANADYTLTSTQGAVNEARNAVITITGNQNATYNVIFPAVPKLYIITNNLSSSAIAYLKVTGSSTSFSVASGATIMVYCTGSNTGTAFYSLNYVASTTTATNLAGGSANTIPIQSGVGTTSFLSAGTSGYILTSGGSGSAPIWSNSFSGNAATATSAITASTATTATTASGLTGTPNITVGTVTSGTQAVTGATGTLATVVASGVSVTSTLTPGSISVTSVLSGLAIKASSSFSIYTSGGTNLFSFDTSGGLTAPTSVSAPTLTSTVATGTAPFTVTSTTPVTNLSIGGNAATATTATSATTATTATNATNVTGTIASAVTATTQSNTDNSTKVATTAYVKSQKYGLGITGETWHDVTGSRSLGSNYTNSNAYPIQVNVLFGGSGNAGGGLYINGALVSYYYVSVYNLNCTCSAIVPPGATYSASATLGGFLNTWQELY